MASLESGNDNVQNAGENRKRKARGRGGVNNNNSQSAGIKQFSNKWMTQVYAEKPPFPEELFQTTFSQEKVETLVEALKLATEKEVQDSIRLLEEDYTYSVVITSHKVPHVPVHLSRITLKHSLQNEESEIALFVKDLKRGRRLDFEPTIQHYENLLREKNVNYKITVIPVNQLYNEFATFELRRKLSFLYDKFLVDRSVAAHVNGFLGSKMLKKGRLALPVDLTKTDLNDELEKSLRKVFYKHVQRGITQNIQVGMHSMSKQLIAENIIDLLRQFGDIHPGGYKNVRKLHLRPQMNVAVSIPIYISLAKPTDGIPTQTTNKEEFIEAQSVKAAEVLENFDINAAGKLVQKRYPSVRILSDDVLLSDDDKDDVEPLPKKPKAASEDDGTAATANVAESPKAAKIQTVQANTPAAPKAANNAAKKRNDNVGNNANNGTPNNRKKAPINRQGNGRAAAMNQNRSAQLDIPQMRNNRNNNNNFDNRSGQMNNNRNYDTDDFTRRSSYGNGGMTGGNGNDDNYNRGFGFSSIANNFGGGGGGGGGNGIGSRLFNNRF